MTPEVASGVTMDPAGPAAAVGPRQKGAHFQAIYGVIVNLGPFLRSCGWARNLKLRHWKWLDMTPEIDNLE